MNLFDELMRLERVSWSTQRGRLFVSVETEGYMRIIAPVS